MQCPFCHAALAQNAKFCRACGKSLTKTCPHCDKPNDLAARFCAGCGYAFSNNAAKESGTEDAGTGSVSSQQPPIDIPRPVPTAPQEPPSPQLVEPENASHSHTSLPTNALDPSANQSVSTQDFSPEPVGLKTDQYLSSPATGHKQPAPAGDAPQRASQSPRGRWKYVWVGILAVLIVTGAAGGYYFYSQSHAVPEIDAVQASQTVEPVPENAPAVPPPAIANDEQLYKPQVSAPEAPPSVKEAINGSSAIVKTDLMTVVIDAMGGEIGELTLHPDNLDGKNAKSFKVIDGSAAHKLIPQSGLIGESLPNHKTLYKLTVGEYEIKPGESSLKLNLTANSNGIEVVKTYTFRRGSYVVNVDYKLSNQSSALVDATPYYQFHSNVRTQDGISTFSGPVFFTQAGKLQKISVTDLLKRGPPTRVARDGWVGMAQHHHISAWATRNRDDASLREFFSRDLGGGEYTIGMIVRGVELASGESTTISMDLYVGPKNQAELRPIYHGTEL